MDIFDLQLLVKAQDTGSHTYQEFFRAETLSIGLSIWPAGSIDEQRPHAEDEVYCIVSGRGAIRVGEADRDVQPGSLIFVAAQVEHRFHTITEDLHVIVFWAPPHHSREK